jgi:hypothetical protein
VILAADGLFPKPAVVREQHSEPIGVWLLPNPSFETGDIVDEVKPRKVARFMTSETEILVFACVRARPRPSEVLELDEAPLVRFAQQVHVGAALGALRNL